MELTQDAARCIKLHVDLTFADALSVIAWLRLSHHGRSLLQQPNGIALIAREGPLSQAFAQECGTRWHLSSAKDSWEGVGGGWIWGTLAGSWQESNEL